MAVLVTDCPHCAAMNSTFQLASAIANPEKIYEWSVFGHCPACHMPVVGVFHFIGPPQSNSSPINVPGNLKQHALFHCVAIFPTRPPTDLPENIPDNVAKAFKQGIESERAGHMDAACGMYRKAMELGLKAFSPDIEAWMIEKRINKMAAAHLITPELQAWAHELRLDGNDALHGDEEATAEMAEQMHGLCKFLLMYLYTLPAQVEATKARRAE